MKFTAILEIDYDLNGESPEELKHIFCDSISHMIGNGGLTTESDAEVNEWTLNITM